MPIESEPLKLHVQSIALPMEFCKRISQAGEENQVASEKADNT